MSWHRVKSESFVFKREQALEFAAKHAGLPHSPVERDVKPKRVKDLMDILRKGLALPFNWAIVVYEGQTVRMNGQHSSLAIKELGAEIPDELCFHFDSYHADDREGMIQLFRQFDQRWSGRTSLDISGAYQGLVPAIADCNKRLTKAIAEAISWCRRHVIGVGEAPTGDNAYDQLHSELYIPFVQWANGIFNNRAELLNRQILAAMWQIHEVSQYGATKFWRDISFGPDYFSDDMAPGAVLISELSQALQDEEFKHKEFETPGHYYRKAVKAWNAFCAGQRISSLKVSKSKAWPEISRFNDVEEAA
jgi:hypothetical protein